MEREYYFILSKNIDQMGLLNDLKEIPNVKLHRAKRYKKKSPVGFLKYLLGKIKFGGRDWGIYDFNKVKLKKDKEYYVVVESGSMNRYEIDYFKKIKKNNIHFLLLLLNSMSASSPTLATVKSSVLSDFWEKVYTFDKYDAEKFGWEYIGMSCFSSLPKCKSNVEEVYSAYYVGGLKGNRNKLIIDTCKKLEEHGIDCKFDLYEYRNDLVSSIDFPLSVTINREWISYSEVLENVQKSNCIIEILQEGQRTQSTRYFEAIFYNKKLLSNNSELTKLPFYDDRYMRYFNTADDIDIDWVKSKEEVNYNYSGEFSSKKIIDRIEQQINI